MVDLDDTTLIAWDFWGVLNSEDPEIISNILQEHMDKGGVNIIVSHSSTYEIETFLESRHLRQYFVKIYGADWHVGDTKLGKTPALKDFIDTHGPFTDQLMVGDSLADIEDGKRAGMRTCLYDPKGFYGNTDHGADACIASLSEVMSLLGKNS